METLHVRAVGDGLLPLVDSDTGVTLMGRYVGRERDGTLKPDGELVPAISYYHSAIARGDLELVGEKE